jgi:hypothetical protein
VDLVSGSSLTRLQAASPTSKPAASPQNGLPNWPLERSRRRASAALARPRSPCWRRKRRHRPARRADCFTGALILCASGGALQASGMVGHPDHRRPKAKPSRPALGRQGRSSGRALHLVAPGQARSTACGSTADGMAAVTARGEREGPRFYAWRRRHSSKLTTWPPWTEIDLGWSTGRLLDDRR